MEFEKKLSRSETTKKLISEGYILKVEKNHGGHQASYNMPSDLFLYLKDNSYIVPTTERKDTRNGGANTVYTLNTECKLILDESVLKYIDMPKDDSDFAFFVTSGNGNKPQMRASDYKYFSNKNNHYNVKWFERLYATNLEGNVMVYTFSEQYKTLTISIKDNNVIEPKYHMEIISKEKYSDMKCNNLAHNMQRLYFGAPGTGKSYLVNELIKKCYPACDIERNPFVFRTTVYADYSYYNFVGNIMPTTKDGEITYDFKAGIFTRALVKALLNEDKEVFLVIEEMSRADIASVFGDIFQLLDRDENGESEYSINNELISYFLKQKDIDHGKITLPRNLHILGTVNTSDQNVNVIDTAFKRRFDFYYTDVDPIKDKNSYTFKFNDGQSFEWNKLYMSLNKFITEKLELPEDKQIGQFFIKFGNYSDDDKKYDAIQNKLLHYLWEDIQNASIVDGQHIFAEEYKTFSSLYKAFKENKNVFSSKFLDVYNDLYKTESK